MVIRWKQVFHLCNGSHNGIFTSVNANANANNVASAVFYSLVVLTTAGAGSFECGICLHHDGVLSLHVGSLLVRI
jgi:hypothetical protein